MSEPTSCPHVPVPPALAHLRRDAHGTVVPVVVPWAGSRPMFASKSLARTVVVARHRLCGVCGLALDPDELYWRVGDADYADLFEGALAAGIEVRGTSSPEPGGHRECFTYAAMVCPFLSSDGTRRLEAHYGALVRPRGEARGTEGLLAAHAGWEFVASPEFVGFHYGPMVTMVRYQDGHELVDQLLEAIEVAPERVANPDAPVLWDPDLGEDEWDRVASRLARGGQRRHTKVGRNEPCPCGSGLKAKRCCHA